jgi:hypothetical protein
MAFSGRKSGAQELLWIVALASALSLEIVEWLTL